MRDHPTFQKWCDWLKVIEEEVSTLFAYRDIFSGTIEIVKNNQKIDKTSPFWGYFIRTYADTIVMGIRRQCKDDKDSISLARLLREIAASPQLVRRSDFESLWTNPDPWGIDKSIMQAAFDNYATPGSPYIESARVTKDLQSLKDACKEVEDYADRRIAHWDKRDPSFDLSLDAISKALENLGIQVTRYYHILFAANLDIRPHFAYPVFRVFEMPWLGSPSIHVNGLKN